VDDYGRPAFALRATAWRATTDYEWTERLSLGSSLVHRSRRRSRQPNLPRPVDDYGDDYGLRVGHFVVHFVAHFVVYASSHGFVGPARAAASSPGPSRPEGRCEERAQVGACADFRPPDAPHLRLSSLGAGPGTGPRYCGAGDREIRVYEYVYE